MPTASAAELKAFVVLATSPPLTFANGFLISNFSKNPANLLTILPMVLVVHSAIGLVISWIWLTFFRMALKRLTNGPFWAISGLIKSAPIRPRADLMFDNAPSNVLLAAFACSPKASSIAAAKVSKEI